MFTSLGLDAHKIFSQQILKNPPVDIRFVFRIDEATVKRGKVNPYEIQYFAEHFKSGSIRSLDSLHLNICIFDNAALITSASLTKTALACALVFYVYFEFQAGYFCIVGKPLPDFFLFFKIVKDTCSCCETFYHLSGKPESPIP